MRSGGPSQNIAPITSRPGISRGLTYTATGIAPHGSTVRATYTVPAGSRAVLENYGLSWHVETLVTTPRINAARVVVTGDSGGAHVSASSAMGPTGNVADAEVKIGFPDVILNAGNIVSLDTEDASTGGTKRYELGADIYEFVS